MPLRKPWFLNPLKWSDKPPADGDTWVWSAAQGKFIPTAAGGGSGPHEVLSATHTDSFAGDTEANLDVLTWIAASSRWEARPTSDLPGGIFHADYVVDPVWAGAAGATLTTVTGSTCKVYTTLKAAVDDANANRQAADQKTVIYLVGGTHAIADAITIAPPSGGSYEFVGSGMERTILNHTVAGTAITQNNVSGSNGRILWRDLTIQTAIAQTMLQAGSGNETWFQRVHLFPNHASAVGIDAGQQGQGLGTFMSQCVISGLGLGVQDGSLYTSNCFFQTAIGVRVNSGSGGSVVIVGGRSTCSTALISHSASGPVMIVVNGLSCDDTLYEASGSGPTLRAMSITDCLFNLGTEVAIDFSQTTGADGSALIQNVNISDNLFYRSAGTPTGIKGHATAGDGPSYLTICDNQFFGFSAGNEYTNLLNCATRPKVLGNLSDAGPLMDQLAETVGFTNEATPTISANQDNWNPTGMASATRVYVINSSVSGSVNISGIAGGAPGRWLHLECSESTTNPIVLKHNVPGGGVGQSASANCFYLPGLADITLTAGDSVTLLYDENASSGSGRWKMIARGALQTVRYVWQPDADPLSDIAAGNHQGPTLKTNKFRAETVVQIVISCETAPGTNVVVSLEYNSVNDLDTESWTEIDSITHTGKGTVTTSLFTNSTIPADRLLRMNVVSISGTPPRDMTVVMETVV